jgi:organic hydroperoxide reductase OsmC/OhrA
MTEYPHFYTASANAAEEGDVRVSSEGLETIATMSPAQFGGPGDRWSPEDLLVAAVADCFVLTFRAVARASKFPWNSISCTATGKLERVDRVTRFTRYDISATLRVPPGTDEHKALRMLERSEHICLITNSMTGEKHLEARVEFDD